MLDALDTKTQGLLRGFMARTAPFDQYGELYERWFEENKYAYLSELEAVRHFIPSGKKGIEIGAGSGRFSVPLGIRIGIEPASEMQRLAAARGMKIINGIAENLPVSTESFDFALMVTTICFVDDLEISLGEIHRILKPHGSFVVGFVDKESPLGKVYQKKRHKSKFYSEATFYSARQVIKLVRRSGFSRIRAIQTVFGDSPAGIDSVQDWEEGFGEGGFCVIEAVKH
jgi:ubiquinone/menaquinone biosynthesis C-methylase UbiE